jgi:cytochrome c oxidase subunit 2
LLYHQQVFVRLTFLADSVAAAGTALLLGAAAMSSHQDPAAASAPFDARANGVAIRSLAHPSTSLGMTLSLSKGQGEPREIAVVVSRFAFDPARIEVTEGERIRLMVSSADGVHGLEIKKFKVNKKVPRGGEKITIDFVASAAGEFPIVCSEYCGNGHEDMKGALVVAVKTPR